MRELGPSGSSVGHRDSEWGVGAGVSGEGGQGEAGQEELSAGLPAAEQPLGRRGEEEEEQRLRVKLL